MALLLVDLRFQPCDVGVVGALIGSAQTVGNALHRRHSVGNALAHSPISFLGLLLVISASSLKSIRTNTCQTRPLLITTVSMNCQ